MLFQYFLSLKREEGVRLRVLFYSLLFLVAQLVKNPPAMRETWVQSLGWEDTLEKEKATHSSILAWKIPRGCKESDTTERLSGIQGKAPQLLVNMGPLISSPCVCPLPQVDLSYTSP